MRVVGCSRLCALFAVEVDFLLPREPCRSKALQLRLLFSLLAFLFNSVP
jgi:hypothetical protein